MMAGIYHFLSLPSTTLRFSEDVTLHYVKVLPIALVSDEDDLLRYNAREV